MDFYVPGMDRSNGASTMMKEILQTTEDSCMTYFRRVCSDFEKAVSVTSSSKAKKNCQRSEQDHLLLHEIACLWIWMLPKLEGEFPGDVVSKYADLFSKG